MSERVVEKKIQAIRMTATITVDDSFPDLTTVGQVCSDHENGPDSGTDFDAANELAYQLAAGARDGLNALGMNAYTELGEYSAQVVYDDGTVEPTATGAAHIYRVHYSLPQQGCEAWFDTRDGLLRFLSQKNIRDNATINSITRYEVQKATRLEWNVPDPFLTGE